MKTWEEFRKYANHIQDKHPDDFYGCVDAEGVWFDSSVTFDVAVHWCCYFVGQYDLSNEGEIEWMNTEGRKLGYSIIHGTMLKKMYEAGLIK